MRKFSLFILLLTLFASLALVACGGATTNTMTDEAEHSDDAGHSEEEGMDDHAEEASVPNNGAVIRIVSPAEGAVFKTTDEVLVQVEVQNFALGEDGNHWHVHLDEGGEIMVMGGNTDQPLRNLTPGDHTIEVRMSTGDHQDLQDGDEITITVEE